MINENQVGKWFEFDCEFGSGAAGTAIVSPIVAFDDHLKPSFMASLDTDDDIPVTVITDSITQLNAAMETKKYYCFRPRYFCHSTARTGCRLEASHREFTY